ncbi:MAG: DUF4097 domain-containing protein [Trueperaceae bacterium]|nr:DUF4097 domain-containing protein [Trueperaceae bacterium]
MNDIERVRALRDAGQITPEEAERLIGVLTELDETPEGVTVEAPNPDAPVGTTDATASGAGATAADRVRSAAREAAEASPVDLAPAGTRWCTIELTAADLSVVADDVDEPVVEGDDEQKLRVTQTDDGVRVTSERGWSVDRWLGRSTSLSVHVRVPRAWGVALDLKAGDADVAGVPYVRGRMLAGDLSVRDAVAVDLSKAAGDLSVAFRPTQGRHRIAAKAGDVDVRFLPGSDANVEASVSMGDLHAPGFEVDDRMVGAQARGRVGAGSARVEVRLTAGDLSLRAPAKEG